MNNIKVNERLEFQGYPCLITNFDADCNNELSENCAFGVNKYF